MCFLIAGYLGLVCLLVLGVWCIMRGCVGYVVGLLVWRCCLLLVIRVVVVSCWFDVVAWVCCM